MNPGPEVEGTDEEAYPTKQIDNFRERGKKILVKAQEYLYFAKLRMSHHFVMENLGKGKNEWSVHYVSVWQPSVTHSEARTSVRIRLREIASEWHVMEDMRTNHPGR